jgi:hypothetical protein
MQYGLHNMGSTMPTHDLQHYGLPPLHYGMRPIRLAEHTFSSTHGCKLWMYIATSTARRLPTSPAVQLGLYMCHTVVCCCMIKC